MERRWGQLRMADKRKISRDTALFLCPRFPKLPVPNPFDSSTDLLKLPPHSSLVWRGKEDKASADVGSCHLLAFHLVPFSWILYESMFQIV